MESENIKDQMIRNNSKEKDEEEVVNDDASSSSQNNEDISSELKLAIDNIESDIKMEIQEEEEEEMSEIKEIVNQENSVLKIASSLTLDTDEMINPSVISVVSEIKEENLEISNDPEVEPSDSIELNQISEDSTDKLISILEGTKSLDDDKKEENINQDKPTENINKEEEEEEKTLEIDSIDKEDTVMDEDKKSKEDGSDEQKSTSEVIDKEEKNPTTSMEIDSTVNQKTAMDTDKSTAPKKRSLSDIPEELINLLTSLSPETLQKFIAEGKERESKRKSESSKVTEKKEPEPMEVDSCIEKENKTSEDVICLDSDDDNEPAQVVPVQKQEPRECEKPKTPEPAIEQEMPKSPEKVLPKVAKLTLKECVNSECPRNVNDEYFKCPLFVMNLYYVTRKPERSQWICFTCLEKANDIYEQLCTNVNNNIPWTSVKIPKKQDLVEIIDSDDEDRFSEKKQVIPESEMIIFDEETEAEVEEILNKIIARVDIKKQLDHEYSEIGEKALKNDKQLKEIDEQLKIVEKQSQVTYDELYAINRPKFERRPSLHIDTSLVAQQNDVKTFMWQGKPQNKSAASTSTVKPPTPQAPAFSTDSFAVRQRILGSHGGIPQWVPCKLLEDDGKLYKVQFNDAAANQIHHVNGKEYAKDKISEILEIGARVIARFPRFSSKTKGSITALPHRWLPGVIGEKLTNYNKRRYLIFCDYGQVKYCSPYDVREVLKTSPNVWDDVHHNLQAFIRDYLITRKEDLKNRALLNLAKGSKILVEQAGNWRQAIVQEVDCSLANIYFPHSKSNEWLYRGSKRLHQIFKQAEKHQSSNQRSAVRRDPGISYYSIEDEGDDDATSMSVEAKKNIAKKSTSGAQQPQPQSSDNQVQPPAANAEKVIILNDATIYLEEPPQVGQLRFFTPKASIQPKTYVKHLCSEACRPALQNDLSSFGPLSKPLLACWDRQIIRHRKNRYVVYRGPCGRRLRDMQEIFNYLRMTKSFLNVDNFDLEPITQVLALYRIKESLCGYYNPDCSNGKEGMKIPVINAFDDQTPPPLQYSASRIPMPGVNINTDPEFMSCCDCTDDCVDKTKCACFQLTICGAKYNKQVTEDDEDISYVWKRLSKIVPTGIYECNSRCKCSSRCLNKVVQHPITVQMQLYRTKLRGWGLRTLHDIPKGTFLCIYAGNLYPEKDANALCQGQDHGDEYFAELDLIEVSEGMKEGYEAGIVYPDTDEDKASDSDSDYDVKNDNNDDENDGDFISKTKSSAGREIMTRSSRSNLHSRTSTGQRTNSEDSDNEIVNMIPSGNTRIPLRKLFGPKERTFIMDAKQCGNVGRYFNHSCDPNLYVQNVFVDTHDLRFPWIAFFTSRHVKASEELTWNYQYEIGSVKSKVLYCHCGSKNCVGRIL